MLAKRFPYAIYYKVDADLCVIWRILDCRQQPKWARRPAGQSWGARAGYRSLPPHSAINPV